MRVLHVAPSLARSFGGPTHSLIGFAAAARTAGFEVTIAGPEPPPDDRTWFAGQLPGTEVMSFSASGRGAFVASPGLLRWLRREVRRFDVAHVHGLWNPVSSLAARVCLRSECPVVIRPFGTLSRYTFAHRRTLLKRVYRRLVDGPNLRAAAGVHFTTDAERDEAAWHGISFQGRSWVIPPPAASSAAPGPAGGANRGEPVVLCLCRLDPIKNLEALLDAWPGVSARVPGARLVGAGDGDRAYVARLRERAAAAGGRVEFAGFVSGSAKAELFAAAALFVLPSHHENFGISVFEALAAGLPVVVSPEVQLAPFVREHGFGEVVSPEPPALAEAIVRSLGDPALAERCALRAPEVVASRYSPAAVGDLLGRMYRSVKRAG
ncbi:MAG TPA: glycosyltransferase [Longimicrobiaceae bacterium]|nr:glycosyltransferase [Longimicrobiaceae bacterium]